MDLSFSLYTELLISTETVTDVRRRRRRDDG